MSRENVAALMDLYPVGERFIQEFTLQAGAAGVSKKRIRALCRWHLQPGGGPGYCETCEAENAACARGGLGLNGEPCPYQKHAPVTLDEHQSWEVFTASLGQLRIAPSGRVLGIDMTAALGIARARGFDEAVVSELLQAAEAGLIEAMNDKDGD